ncbi:hypothetical protein B0H14DRAFT_2564793 [Mycena olivaceomarginata]|nr:hypothetical protein B0H14DRAFT_2564793 [Mycena olivaceomarginata]
MSTLFVRGDRYVRVTRRKFEDGFQISADSLCPDWYTETKSLEPQYTVRYGQQAACGREIGPLRPTWARMASTWVLCFASACVRSLLLTVGLRKLNEFRGPWPDSSGTYTVYWCTLGRNRHNSRVAWFLLESVSAINVHSPITFLCLILLPILGNVTEHWTAFTMAKKDKMTDSLDIAVGSDAGLDWRERIIKHHTETLNFLSTEYPHFQKDLTIKVCGPMRAGRHERADRASFGPPPFQARL